MPFIRRVAIVAVLAVGFALPFRTQARAQEPSGVRFTSRAAEIAVGGRVQTMFSTTTADGAIPALWEVRRARLELAIRAHPVISARLQPEFSGTQIALRDAYVALAVAPATQLLVGNAFRPFSLVAQTSSTLILPIERGARIRGASPAPLEHYALVQGLGYADRDFGIQLRTAPAGAPLNLNVGFGVFNGPAQTAAGEELSLQYAGRASIAFVPNLRFGAGWSRRDFVVPESDQQPARIRAGNAWEIDLEIGGYAPGFHLVGELAAGDLDPFAGEQQDGQRFSAAQLWIGYRSATTGTSITNVEPIVRISHGDPQAGGGSFSNRGGTLFTPGINLYFGPLNRIMINFDAWRARDGGTESSLKTLFQIAF
jgi:hypothetical protein